MRLSHTQLLLAVLGLIMALASIASADTEFVIEAGWGSMPRADRWTPVFVTASDSKTRNVVLEVEWPVGGSYSMHVQQAMTIDATERTFPLLLPIHGWMYQQAQFTLIDRDTGKSLAHFPKDPDSPQQLFGSGYSDPAAAFIGMSGTQNALTSLTWAIGTNNTGYLPTQRLPAVPLGYDALDVLVLNAPTLVRTASGEPPLEEEQQLAIVDWVRAGGKLILWPGDAGFPAKGPLADVLPAKVVGAENIELSAADLTAIGLTERYKSLPVHRLEARGNVQRIPMLNSGQVSAYATNLGLGRIVLAPMNIADLNIVGVTESRNFWRPLLKDMIALPADQPADAPAAPAVPNYGYMYGGSRDSSASMRIADFLGDVKGAGQIGFAYIAYVLIGLMLVVGPVDWFVLKKLGRQPWTWVTTSGWIALVTTAALFAGYMFKSGDLHYRTLCTIDQVGNETVASAEYVSLYSSRTRAYEINTDSDGWWQPGAVNEYGGSGLKLDIDFHQTNQGNTPEDMVVNVWSLRYLRGDHMGVGPPMIAADLRHARSSDQAFLNSLGSGQYVSQIIGTITNLTDKPLKNVRIEVKEGSGVCVLAQRSTTAPATNATGVEILPHETVHVAVTAVPEPAPAGDELPYQRYRSYQQTDAPAEPDLWKAAAELNYRRGKLMADRIATGESAIVYAETEDPAPAAELMHQKAIEKHYQFIRALVDLHEGREK